MLPDDKKPELIDQITELKARQDILKKTDERLEFIDDFNKRLNIFDQGVKEMESWLDEGRKRLDQIKAEFLIHVISFFRQLISLRAILALTDNIVHLMKVIGMT